MASILKLNVLWDGTARSGLGSSRKLHENNNTFNWEIEDKFKEKMTQALIAR